jgi:hypothetical protein
MTSTMRFDKWENSLGQPYGTVLQVVQTMDQTTTSISSGSNMSFLAYTKLNTTVTPRANNSKFLIRFQLNIGTNGNGSHRVVLQVNGSPQGSTGTGDFRASTNSTWMATTGLPHDATILPFTGESLFQNSGTTAVSLTFEIFRQEGAQPLFVNRAFGYDDAARGRPSSWVTIMEIAQ